MDAINDEVQAAVTEAMNPEEFDVLDYLDELPVARSTVDIYTHLGDSRRLAELMDERARTLLERREAERRGEATGLAISDEDEDTEYDDEINELVARLEKSKMVVHIQSVSPETRKAIDARYREEAQDDWDAETRTQHDNRRVAEILSLAIEYVVLGDGRRDTKVWDADRLMKAEVKLYEAQSKRLVSNLWNMVFTGDVFEQALTADFS